MLKRLFEVRDGDDGLPGRERKLALLALVTGTQMAVLDSGIVNIALPTLADELDISGSASIWIANVYQLVTAALLLTFAALSRVIGRHRLYIGGLAVFTLASLACALSRSFELLLVSRMLQGIGAAAMLSIGPSLYRVIFPTRLLGSAIGLSALTVAFGIAAGPSIGGLILHLASWPWLFAINVPVGGLALFLATRSLPREPARRAHFDVWGALLSIVMLSGSVFALDQFGHGGGGAMALVTLALALVCLVGFVYRQRHVASPLVPLALFEEPRFSFAAVTSMFAFLAQGIAFVGLPFLYQTVMGVSPIASALLFTPWPLVIMVIGPVAGRLADKGNPALISSMGLGLFLLGMLALTGLDADSGYVDVIWRTALCGVGYGLFQAPNNREMIGSVPLALSANASGVLASVRTFGQSLGTALVGLILGLSFGSLTLSLWLGCVSVVVALGLSLYRVPLAARDRRG
ncbi:MFS transporter [Salinicola sp. JS01]|uniref:MFS transporter n=1 Tax=Salinicola sp. JS01 TaxID=3050071 RepID=UPI00255B8D0E|nr:MFS transporter [Salinicola sp. JS01]WIX32062.1 MFS transporter [Salinicola sp. JS01]